MNETTATKLIEAGGKLWEKNGMRRIYFDADLVFKNAGLHVSHYNTGNISNATINGEKISNSEAKRIIAAISFCKLWYDITDGKFYYRGDPDGYKYLITDFFNTLRAAVA